MRKINLLDCTLRDGGYINDWHFGKKGIQNIINKLEKTGIEMIEIGFLKGNLYDPDFSIFPDIESFKSVLLDKKPGVHYVGMLDMSNPIPLDRVIPNDGSSIDGIRVIFKKDKLNEAYRYCEHIKALGYSVFANFVSTDVYSDKEFIEGLEMFSQLELTGIAIVDTFGVMKRRQFQRLIYLADNNLKKDTMLCYHAHNNLQQAFGNAEAMIEMNLNRNIVIDACVFGMGRGAGNLNLELFAEYMNENYGTNYRIAPMLEIMDEYLSEFYHNQFWGYSLPLYLSATLGCHPNYAIYYAEKGTLSVKAFNEILGRISDEDKLVFDKEKAEKYYKEYFRSYIDDKETIERLSLIFNNKSVLLIAPGESVREYYNQIELLVATKKTLVVAVNTIDKTIQSDFVFCSNMRRFSKIPKENINKVIATSNIENTSECGYCVNYSSYLCGYEEIIDNAGIMALKVLNAAGVRKVFIAGMDGYKDVLSNASSSDEDAKNHFALSEIRNNLISKELKSLNQYMQLEFITPTRYEF